MRYAILIIIQLFMGMTMANGQNEELINEILQLRGKIESIAMDETLSDERKMFLIYRLMPTTKEKHSILYTGDYKQLLDKEDKIGTWTKKLDSTPLRRLINEAPKHVPPYLIIEKFSDIIHDNPLDVEAIINSTNFEGERPEWPVFDYYRDANLFPPAPGGSIIHWKNMNRSGPTSFNAYLSKKVIILSSVSCSWLLCGRKENTLTAL